jgi:hypothetical protein
MNGTTSFAERAKLAGIVAIAILAGIVPLALLGAWALWLLHLNATIGH